ncbi:hypothetical protein CVT24_007031 [Panaeolus cyanescens]|uniref:F-box domain-containing protein n=1 Tax=Panaeolus cyanescens TaxID=181874 RepID=A0A409YLT2_9AGAR|nr:hypothetical protein CVT24_007031 [Panaeolus cyanescens]
MPILTRRGQKKAHREEAVARFAVGQTLAPTVPVEILTEIISYILSLPVDAPYFAPGYDIDNSRDELLPPRQLRRTITLHSLSQTCRLWRRLLENEDLASYVNRYMRVALVPSSKTKALPALVECLDALPNLKALAFHFVNPRIAAIVGKAFEGHVYPHLQTLAIKEEAARLFPCFPGITKLVLIERGYGNGGSDKLLQMVAKTNTVFTEIRAIDGFKLFVPSDHDVILKHMPNLRFVGFTSNASQVQTMEATYRFLSKLQKLDTIRLYVWSSSQSPNFFVDQAIGHATLMFEKSKEQRKDDVDRRIFVHSFSGRWTKIIHIRCSTMIAVSTLFLATLVFNAATVLGAPVRITPASALESRSVPVVNAVPVPRANIVEVPVQRRSNMGRLTRRSARLNTRQEEEDINLPRGFVDVTPEPQPEKRHHPAGKTEGEIVRRFPRRVYAEYYGKREPATKIKETTIVVEKTTIHDTPYDAMAANMHKAVTHVSNVHNVNNLHTTNNNIHQQPPHVVNSHQQGGQLPPDLLAMVLNGQMGTVMSMGSHTTTIINDPGATPAPMMGGMAGMNNNMAMGGADTAAAAAASPSVDPLAPAAAATPAVAAAVVPPAAGAVTPPAGTDPALAAVAAPVAPATPPAEVAAVTPPAGAEVTPPAVTARTPTYATPGIVIYSREPVLENGPEVRSAQPSTEPILKRSISFSGASWASAVRRGFKQ